MSNQLQITGGAKVRNLEGVLTGTSGVVSSLGINVPSGIPQLDGSGKILVSQLPNSVMEYKGTWNAATNTPTLTNGTGNAGDVYLCDTAGTVNFGAGPITFAVGDQVLYSGSIWQKASGASGTVTSVGLSSTAAALTITNSPITTSGNIGLNFSGNSGQYVSGDGNLVTFPTIITQAQNLVTEVYNSTGATLSKGTVVYINGGHGNLPTVAKAIATSDATSAQTYGVVRADITNNNNGYVTVFGNIDNIDTQAYSDGTQLYLSGTTAGAWTSTKPSAPIHLVYIGIVVRSHPTQGVVEVRIQNGYELGELHDVAITSVANNDGIFYNSSNSLWENKTISEVLGYTPANDSLVVKLAGTQTITGQKTFTSLIYANNNIVLPIAGSSSITYLANIAGTGMTSSGSNYIGFNTNNDFYFAKDNYHSCVFVSNNSAVNYYTLQDGSGTLAFTSDIPSLTNYVTLNGTQTITGVKTFSNEALFGNNITLTGGDFVIGNSGFDTSINTETLTASRSINFPNKSGVVAMISDIPSLSGYVPYTGATNNLNMGSGSYGINAGQFLELTKNGSNTLGGSSFLGFTNAAGTDAVYLQLNSNNDLSLFGKVSGTSSGPLVTFTKTGAFSGTSATFSARVQVTGNVAPSSGTGLELYYDGSAAGTVGYARGTGYIPNIMDGSALQFFTSSNEKMRITASGVGIGTTSPSSQLQVVGTGTAFRIGESSGTTGKQLLFSIDAADGHSEIASIWQGTSATSLCLNPTGGNVGIGITNPIGKLHAYLSSITSGNSPASSGTTPVNAMLNLTNNRGVGMYFGGSYSGSYGQWIQVSDVGNLGVNYPLLLNPNGGSIGIGTNNPTYRLEVNSGSSDYTTSRMYSSGHTYLLLESTTAARQSIIGYLSPTREWSVGLQGDGSFSFYDNSASSHRLRISTSGNIQTSGPVFRYNGTTTVGGSLTNLTTIDGSSSRTYLIQMIPTNVEANLSYRIFGVIQINATSSTYTFVSLASQTMEINFSGSTVQARVTNGQQWNFNWSITQLL